MSAAIEKLAQLHKQYNTYGLRSGLSTDEVANLTGDPIFLVQNIPLQTDLTDLYIYFGQFGEVKVCGWFNFSKKNTQPCKVNIIDEAGLHTVDLNPNNHNHHHSPPSKQAVIQIVEPEASTPVLGIQHWFGNQQVKCSLVLRKNKILQNIIDEVNSRKVFVFGLKKSVGEEFLRKYFSQFGSLQNVRIVRHRKDNSSKGFGFLVFRTLSGKQRATDSGALIIEGKPIKCVPFWSFNTVERETKQPCRFALLQKMGSSEIGRAHV